jgi:predicted dehydrogenase
MKIAVIGAGDWGKNLVRTLSELGALGAIVDANPTTRAVAKKDYPDVPVFETPGEIVQTGITAVAIATPVATHFSLAREALEQSFDVFVEKPMTLSSREAETLTRLAAMRSRILMVGHLLLYQPAVLWISSFLKEGGLGHIYSLHQERLNLGKVRSVENALWSLGVHDVAVLLHLVGSRTSNVQVTGHRVLQPGIEDDVYLHLEFQNGVQAHLHTSWLWPEKRRQLVIVGEKGMLVYDELAKKVTLHRKHITPDLANADAGSEVVFQQTGEPLKLELEHFLARLQDRQPPLSDGKNGMEVVRVLELASQVLEAK